MRSLGTRVDYNCKFQVENGKFRNCVGDCVWLLVERKTTVG